jgi:hypothetical protein
MKCKNRDGTLGCVEIIPIGHGKAHTHAAAVELVCLAPACNPSDGLKPPRMPEVFVDEGPRH